METTAQENAATAKQVITQFADEFTPVDQFTFEVFGDDERSLDFTMQALTGSFEFECERIDMAGVMGYRLFLPRTDQHMQEVTR